MRGGAALVPYPLMINPAGMHRPRPIGIAARTQGGPASPGSLSSIPEGTSRSRPGLGLSSSFAPAPAATSTPAAVGSHILVVDDAVSNRKLLMRIFRLKGFICEEACDGQQALDVYANMCAKHTPPGVILMDYEMPVLDGPSATKQLREKGCSCFIIGVTGNVVSCLKYRGGVHSLHLHLHLLLSNVTLSSPPFYTSLILYCLRCRMTRTSSSAAGPTMCLRSRSIRIAS